MAFEYEASRRVDGQRAGELAGQANKSLAIRFESEDVGLWAEIRILRIVMRVTRGHRSLLPHVAPLSVCLGTLFFQEEAG